MVLMGTKYFTVSSSSVNIGLIKLCLKKTFPLISMNNSTRSEPILITFGVQRRGKHQKIMKSIAHLT